MERTAAGIEKYSFLDLFDLDNIQCLVDAIAMALEVGITIVSPEGRPITKPSNFCDFCTRIVKQTQKGRENCRDSHIALSKKSERPVVSRCLAAGFVDASISIIVNGKHLANWIVGQVILEDEEMSSRELKEKAELLGVDEAVFMEGRRSIPGKTRQQFDRILEMVQVLAMQLSELGLKNYLQKEELVYRIRLEEELRREKAHLEYYNKYDELTGVFSRNYYEERLDELCRTGQYPIAVISGDMNNLKLMNDVFGHQHGDMMLRSLGRVLRAEAEPDYIIGRCGGDEFNIVIPTGSDEKAKDYCRRVHRACRDTMEGMIPPSVSLGYQIMKSADDNVRQITREAEESMYNAKLRRKQKQNIHRDILEVLFRRKYLSRDQVEKSVIRVGRFAEFLGLDKRETDVLKLSAQIQDIGLIAVPEYIVRKETSRSREEGIEMEKHTRIGYRLAKLYDESFPVANIILQSHECWRGQGYPEHLKGEEILFEARLLYLVTSYSYWIHEKPNGSGMTVADARQRLRDRAGDQFDPELTWRFLEYLEEEE